MQSDILVINTWREATCVKFDFRQMLPGPFSREKRNVKKFDVSRRLKHWRTLVFSRDQAFTSKGAKCRDLDLCRSDKGAATEPEEVARTRTAKVAVPSNGHFVLICSRLKNLIASDTDAPTQGR